VSRSFLSRFRKPKPAGAVRIALCEERILASGGEEIALARAEGAPAWRPALDALPQVLARFRDREAGIVLADQFVRYALLPWSDTLKTHAQWLALARHRFCAIHGPLANGWEIRFAETAPAGPRLACAVDAELVDELAARFSGTGVQLVSVLPFLVAAFNQVRHQTGGSCWLVIEEQGRLTFALFLRGVWVAIRSRRSDAHWRRALPEILAREAAFLGLEEPCTRVIVCAQDSFDAAGYEDFRLDAMNYRDLALASA
jgi:hypothetical protein